MKMMIGSMSTPTTTSRRIDPATRWSYPLNAAEQDVLLRKMEEYCQQQTGMSLHDYAQQFREEPEQRQGPVMKL